MNHSIEDYVNQLEEKYADRTAFRWINEDEQICEKSYSDFVQDVQDFAAYLQNKLDAPVGKHIAFLAGNSYPYAVGLIGTMLAGAVAVPLNPRESETNLTRMLDKADCSLIFADQEQMDTNTAIAAFPGKKLPLLGYTAEKYALQPLPQSSASDLAILMFTSGTTSASKCVMLTYRNLFAALEYMYSLHNDVVSFTKIECMRAMHLLPFHHIIGIISLLIWTAKGELVNMCTDMRYLQRDLELLPSDYLVVVPAILAMWSRFLLKGKRNRLGDIKCILSGGAAIPEELMKLYVDNDFGLFQSWGMTEASGFGFYNFVNKTRNFISNGTAGKNVSIKIDDGEICLKSDLVMPGYYKDEAETSAALCDGWLRTGDMGHMDENGHVYLTGRKKNLIILASGENVSPEELENLVSKNADVKEVVVKEKAGKICAEVFCDADKQEEIRSFITEVNRSLAMYKRMTLVEFRSEPFPRTASGKIKRI